MRGFITDRTQADVDRCKELAAKGWNNMTEAEKAEWYGTAMRGAYNYSDLNRVESAVAELSAFLEMRLTTKTNWGMWDFPTQTDMRRYVSNLQAVKERYSSSVQIPDAVDGFTYESANNIEKMLSETCAVMDASDVWKKSDAEVTYSWVYTRDDDNEIIGTKGVGTTYETVWNFYDGTIKIQRGFPANDRIYFSDSRGFYLDNESYYGNFPSGAASVGRYVGKETECRRVTALLGEELERFTFSGDPTVYEYYKYTYEYEVVGYATKAWTPSCKNLGTGLKYAYFPQGDLPEGTLVKGSYAEGYCYVQEADGKYYYYELR